MDARGSAGASPSRGAVSSGRYGLRLTWGGIGMESDAGIEDVAPGGERVESENVVSSK